MKREKVGERSVGAADVVVLAAVIALALVSWICFATLPTAPLWKPWLSVAVALVLALASLTRHGGWARTFRAATALWIVSAPAVLHVLGIGSVASAHAVIAAVVGATVPWPRLRGRPAPA